MPTLAELPADSACVSIISFEEQTRGWLAALARRRRARNRRSCNLRLPARLRGGIGRSRTGSQETPSHA